MNYYYIIWIIVIVIALIVEVATLGLTSIWFAAAGLITLLLSFFIPWLPVQIGIFLILSALMMYFFYPMLRNKIKKDTVKTNVDAVVGKEAIVTEAIDNIQAAGQVKLSGQFWTARSVDDVEIEKGTHVIVEEVKGVKLMVKELKKIN